MAIDDEQAWNKISRDAMRDGFRDVASKAKYLAGQAAYSKPLGAMTPAWSRAKTQAQQAVNNIRFGVTDDLALQRQQMFQDISLSGLRPGTQNRLMRQMESEIDPIIDRQLQLDTMQKNAELDMASDAAMEQLAPDITSIMTDQAMPIEQKFQNLSALQMSVPALAGNKKYDSLFKSAFDSLRNQQWTRSVTQQSLLDVDEKALKRLAEQGNVNGLKSYIERRGLQQGQYDLEQYRALAESQAQKGAGLLGVGTVASIQDLRKKLQTGTFDNAEAFNLELDSAISILQQPALESLRVKDQGQIKENKKKLLKILRDTLDNDDKAKRGLFGQI
jgi:hypothetical protein|tara:strand:+ start:160 stop:1155 length:996 start_codon:yes stop_codon:yes gene_type:complete